ncbi:MAG: winged helix-turn-helix domain-containing protein [Lentisphaeria bacterium]|nr:winged helix-turn-helix domain-containing protein [Lentisphaeria bacterium]
MSKSTPIINKFKNQILSGQLKHGDRLPNRNQLMEDYQVARATADRIINKLVEQGLAISQRGKGAFVQHISNAQKVILVINAQNAQTYQIHFHSKVRYHLIQVEELEQYLKEYQNYQVKIIWSHPRQKEYSYLGKISFSSNCFHLVVNRRSQKNSSISTDTVKGIQLAMDLVAMLNEKIKKWLCISEVLDPFAYFYTERELFFYRELAFRQQQLIHHACISSRHWEEMNTKIDESINHCPREEAFGVLITEQRRVPVFLEKARQAGLIPGKDFILVMLDYNEQFDHIKGIISLEQNLNAMAEAAAKWALSDNLQKISQLIPHNLIYLGKKYEPEKS